MTKTELMLAKPTLIESLIHDLFARRDKMAGAGAAQQAQVGVEAKAGGMWEDMMKAWEDLTAVKHEGATAIIPLRGTVTPDDPFSPYFGETNLAMFTKNLNEALDNPKVKSIVLNIYSPGGYVYGVEAAANRVYEGRKKKPIYAYTDSLAASAAYWIASAATKVVLGSETAEVGSIGVYLAHFDYSEMLKGAGIKVTEITSGEFKGIGSPYSEMTAEEKKILQADSQHVYNRFVNTVARNRGMSPQETLKSANGLTFYGTDAIKAGLADSINTLQEVIAMSTATQQTQQTEAEKAAATAAEQKAAAELTAAQAKNAELEAQLAAYKAKETETAKAALKAEANVAYKAAFGRDATAEEQDAYAESSEAGRKVIAATLKETAENRDKLAGAAGLTTETATNGVVEDSGDKSPLVMAGQRLGLIAIAKK